MANVYCITNNITGEKYVGQTIFTIEDRFHKHCLNSKRDINMKLYDSMKKYGCENFSVSLLETVNNADADDREIYWIYRLDTVNTGLNSVYGGIGRRIISNEERDTIVKEYNKGYTVIAVGLKFNISPEKVSAILKENNIEIDLNRGHTHKKAVDMYDLDENKIMSFNSQMEAGRYICTEIKPQNIKNASGVGNKISYVCNGARNTAYGYKWKYPEHPVPFHISDQYYGNDNLPFSINI